MHALLVEISCSLSGAPKDGSISVRIGCHTDSLHKLDEWKRVPEITMQVSAGRVKMVIDGRPCLCEM